MIYDIQKALESFFHPGIDTTPRKLMRNAFPYYAPMELDAKTPLTVYWSINSVCNLRCKMCDVGTADESGIFFKNLRIDKKLREIDIEVFKSVIDAVAADKPFISINSTEPLMYKPIAEAVRYCTDRGLSTAITTGGYLLPAKAAELAEAGLTRLNVSIDGPADLHNAIRGRKDSYERDVEGIKLFAEESKKRGHKSEILVNCTISNLNYRAITPLVDSLEGLPIDRINFCYLWFIDDATSREHNNIFGTEYPVSVSCNGPDIHIEEVDVDFLYAEVQKLKQKKNVHFLSNFTRDELYTYFHKPGEFVRPTGKCLASWFFIQILADGNVIPYTRCHNQSLGNVNTQSFEAIWNGEKMKNWRSFIKRQKKMPMCRRCDVAY